MKITFFLSLLCWASSLFGGETPLKVDGSYVFDPNSSFELTNFPRVNMKPFAPRQQLNVGYNRDAAVWCIFNVSNTDTKRPVSSWFCFNNNHLDSISFYNGRNIELLGDRTTQVSPFLYRQAFRIELQPGEQKQYIARVKKGVSFLEFSYSIEDGKLLQTESMKKLVIVSFFIGLIFLLLIFNSILFVISRKRVYLYYFLYSMLSVVYVSISSYYAKFLLVPDFIYISEARIYSASLWMVTLSLFLSHYLHLRKNLPRVYLVIMILNAINVALIFITIVMLINNSFENLRVFFTVGYINFLTIIMLMFISALISFKFDRARATYVILAFVPQIVWGSGIILKTFFYIPRLLPEDSLVYICLYEVLLFGYVLSKNYVDTFSRNRQLIRQVLTEKKNSLQAITQAQIRERRLISNIIHDNLGSKIAYILQLLQLKNLELANANMKELAQEIREISHRILPKSLDDGALLSSLTNQIDALNNGLPYARIEIHSFDFPERIKEVWVHDLYLISLELINNSLKHGKAKSIVIELYAYSDAYVFQYSDDGVGFNLPDFKKGFGLDNVEKRVAYYHGEFEINSTPKEGTIVQIIIPLHPEG